VTELLNQTAHALLYERAIFFGGAMHNAPPLSLGPGRRTYWTSGQGSSGMDLMRGNLSAVIFTLGINDSTGSTAASGGASGSGGGGDGGAELLLITHLSRLQVNAQCVGVRIGPVGAFTAMDEKQLRALVVDSTASLTTSWQRVTDRATGLEALASFGRDPARFLVRPLAAAGSSPLASTLRSVAADTALALPECERGMACMAVCQLENRSTLTLQLNRAAFAAGEPRAAVDVTPLPPGGMMPWSCASPPGMKQGFGNEGVLIFGCHEEEAKGGELVAELALVWRLPYTMKLPAENRVGALLGTPNSFSSTFVVRLSDYWIISAPCFHLTLVCTLAVMTHEQLLSLSSPQTDKHLDGTGKTAHNRNDQRDALRWFCLI
jgi:hypothetical protein